MIKEIDVREAKKLLDKKKAFLLDVREKEEFDFVNLNPDKFTTPTKLPNIIEELPKDKLIIAMCRTGSRSAMAADYLEKQGFEAANMRGGIFAWHDEIDSSIPKYAYFFDGQKIVVEKIND